MDVRFRTAVGQLTVPNDDSGIILTFTQCRRLWRNSLRSSLFSPGQRWPTAKIISNTNKEYSIPQTPQFDRPQSKRHCQDQEQSALWYVACGTPFSDKPTLVISRSRVSHASLLVPVVRRSCEARCLCP